MTQKKKKTIEKKTSKWLALTGVSLFVLAGAAAGFFYMDAQAEASAPEEAPQAQMQAPQAMPVDVEIATKEPVTLWKEFSGRLEAVNYAEIRPQVSGTISEILFEAGQDVNNGELLYVIDPRPYEATVAQAQAALTAAQTTADYAVKEAERAASLIKTDAISKRILDARENDMRVAQAAVEAAQATLQAAQIDLDYAHVKAPFSGRVSRAEITEGNLVEAGPNAPILTSIVSNDTIYADFEVDEQTYLSYVRSVAKDRASEKTIPVELSIASSEESYKGNILSFDNIIDVSSGTIRARALFDNHDRNLLPGMFVQVKLGSPIQQEAILISDRAIGTNQDRKFVYVISDEGTIGYRNVTLGANVKGKRIITSGLEGGEQVITDGIIRLRPGMPVVAKSEEQKAQEQAMSQGHS